MDLTDALASKLAPTEPSDTTQTRGSELAREECAADNEMPGLPTHSQANLLPLSHLTPPKLVGASLLAKSALQTIKRRASRRLRKQACSHLAI